MNTQTEEQAITQVRTDYNVGRRLIEDCKNGRLSYEHTKEILKEMEFGFSKGLNQSQIVIFIGMDGDLEERLKIFIDKKG